MPGFPGRWRSNPSAGAAAGGASADAAGESTMSTTDIELGELGPSSSDAQPGTRQGSDEAAPYQAEIGQQGPSLVVIEDPTGNIYLGMDVPRWEKEAEERRRNAPQIANGTDDGGTNLDEFMPFTEEHYQALVARRRSGCLFLLSMDIAYLVFVMMIPFISPGAYGYGNGNADAAGNSTNSFTNATSGGGFNSSSFNQTAEAPSESGSDSSGGLSAIERTMIEISVYIAVDLLGMIACLRSSPGLLTVFVTLLSCVTVLTAVAALSPVLVFRMIIIMLSLQLRSGILLVRPQAPRERVSLRRRLGRLFGRREGRGAAAAAEEEEQGGAAEPEGAAIEETLGLAAVIHQPVTANGAPANPRDTPAASNRV